MALGAQAAPRQRQQARLEREARGADQHEGLPHGGLGHNRKEECMPTAQNLLSVAQAAEELNWASLRSASAMPLCAARSM